MARGSKSNGYGYPNPFNEIDSRGMDPVADVNGQGLYFDGWDEINKFHLLQTGPMDETPNSRSGRGIMGGPAPGEPNPAKMPGD